MLSVQKVNGSAYRFLPSGLRMKSDGNKKHSIRPQRTFDLYVDEFLE